MFHRLWSAAASLLLFGFLSAPFCYAQSIDLTGLWVDDSRRGGVYRVRQIGNKVYWASPDGEQQRSVFTGTISGATITGEWVDLPGSPRMSAGTMRLSIESSDRFVKLSNEPCCYEAQVWTRQGTNSGSAPGRRSGLPTTSPLPSIDGIWFSGSRPASIAQDAADRSRLVFVNELGDRSNGRFLDASTVIAEGWGNGLRGTLESNGNLRWANGTTWIPQPSIAGNWTQSGQAVTVRPDPNDRNRVIFTNEKGSSSRGRFLSPTTVIAEDWNNGLLGTIDNGGKRIRWANGTAWAAQPSIVGAWSEGGRATLVSQDPNDANRVIFTNEKGNSSRGRFIDAATVIAEDWEGGLRGTVENNGNRIRWANGTIWTLTRR